MKRIYKIIHFSIVALSSIVLLSVAILSLLPQVSSFAPISVYTIESGSMEPALPTHSVIVTQKPTSASAITAGTIITFAEPRYENKYITHRVVGTKPVGSGQLFITQGDTNDRPDSWEIPFNHIQGSYLFHIPFLGYAVSFIRSLAGILLLVVLPVVVIAIAEMRNIVNILVDKKVRVLLARLSHRKSKVRKLRTLPPSPATIQLTRIDSVQAPPAPKAATPQRPQRAMTAALLALLLAAATSIPIIHPALAQFIGNTVSITHNSLSTAAIFESPTPTPSPSPEPSPSSTPEPTASPSPCEASIDINQSNTDTAADSVNENSAETSIDCKTSEENTTVIANDANINASTGDNTSGDNTEAGTQTSGNVETNLTIVNEL